MRLFPLFAALAASTTALAAQPPAPPQPGLLFALSGDRQFAADYAAGGDPQPTYLRNVQVIPGGASGPAFQCADTQLMAYAAPGNIYAQRGTLSFFWRSRYAVGPTPFPIFRVAYGDHSSWDMVFLRVDYNGHGFDAFVTDASLARTRVSVSLDAFPKPDEWTHLAVAWDETRGLRFYVNGKLAAEKQAVAVYNAALDQFGPHSRIISPHQVQSDYNFVRGGDLDELRIYDRMLSDENVAALARNQVDFTPPPLPARSLSDPRWREEWYQRYGFGTPAAAAAPPYDAAPALAVRKVEIHDAYDLKRWWWKANDGIRETTWPGVYNRSRLPGRNDYFQLPDWDCYSGSGQSITFTMPDEPWNQIEISGSAWGKMELLAPGAATDGLAARTLFERPKGPERTINRLPQAITGRKIRFTNVEREEPIGELAAYNVSAGREPTGTGALPYRLTTRAPVAQDLAPLIAFINGRHPTDERAMLIAQPTGVPPLPAGAPPEIPSADGALPLVHVLIPDTWDARQDGLDGIAIDLPALNVRPTHGELFPLNLQVKDPLWPMRNMLDYTFSVKPGEAKTLWLDLRDRLLPAGKPLYLTLAAAGGDLTPALLEGAQLRLVFKPREAARAEHELDRFTQARDSYAMLVEEHPRSPKLNLWNRFEADLTDLMRVNPDHLPGRYYAAVNLGAAPPPVNHPTPPAGVPLWAFRQVELLGRVDYFVNWYIDNRQIDNGEFGGGLSDDTDLTNTWPGVALMGYAPDKLAASLRKELEACFNNGMFTNGLSTIQADELHSYEEGINCLAENMLLDLGNPRQIERAMETQRGIERVTGVNPAGRRLFRSSYYSGTTMAEDAPWGNTKAYSYLVIQPGQLLVDFNGNPRAKQVLVELADGLLAHRHPDASGRYVLPDVIDFKTDQEGGASRRYFPWHVFWAAYQWTGDKKYLAPITDGGAASLTAVNANVMDLLNLRNDWPGRTTPGRSPAGGPAARPGRGAAADAPAPAADTAPARPAGGAAADFFAWQLTGDKRILERLYTSQIDQCARLEYINTEGSLWIDRVNVPHTDLQRSRLGGAALVRNALYPGHTVSWRFDAPATDRSLAILLPDATPAAFKVIAYNLETSPVTAALTGWNVDPGQWDITQGVDTNDDDVADGPTQNRTAAWERSAALSFTFPPRATTILTFKLKTPGTPYWQRPDWGISAEDVATQGDSVAVTVHSLGSVDCPAGTAAVVDAAGKVLASAPVPPLPAPNDLMPRTVRVTLALPPGARAAAVELNPGAPVQEITRLNNRVPLR